MRAHKLKIWPDAFRASKDARLTCQIRQADRDLRVGDYLMLVEFDPKKDQLTGQYHCVLISHITTAADHPRGLIDGFVALSTEEIMSSDEKSLLGQDSGLWKRDVEWVQPVAGAPMRES
jgi:hypothetical protein